MADKKKISLADLLNGMAEMLFDGKASPASYIGFVEDSVDADCFTIMKLSPGEDRFKLLAGLGISESPDEIEAPLILEEAASMRGRGVISPTGSFVCDPFLNAEKVRSFLMARGGLRTGTLLTLAMRRESKAFTSREIERFTAVTNYANLVSGFLELSSDLKKHSDHDSLTGLLNFTAFHNSLRRELSRARRHQSSLCLGMISVEGLGDFWSSCGQISAENIILKISRAIKGSIRDFDILGRYSPLEFSLILPEMTVPDGIHTAERVLASMREAASDLSGDGDINFRIGLANYPEDTTTTEKLLEVAEAALVKAREGGSEAVVKWEE